MYMDSLVDLLLSPEPDHRRQGGALFSALASSTQKALYCELICQSDWQTALAILSKEDPEELQRLQWVVRARVMLRSLEIRQQQDWPIPDGMMHRLNQMLDAPTAEHHPFDQEFANFTQTFRYQTRRYRRIRPPLILRDALETGQDAQRTALSLKRYYIEAHNYHFFIVLQRKPHPLPYIGELAMARANASVFAGWLALWSDLCREPTFMNRHRTVYALEVMMRQARTRWVDEERYLHQKFFIQLFPS